MTRKTLEQVETAIARWNTKVRRAVNAIAKLEAQKKRLLKAASKPSAAPPAVKTAPVAPRPVPEIAAPAAPVIDTEIPAFLRRERKPDPVAAEIVAQQEATKKAKAAGRKAAREAKARGDTRKMPLTGKAALAAIRG